ncbi:MAG: hypothetical protein ABI432_14455 [Flavobacteriales bacterium]
MRRRIEVFLLCACAAQLLTAQTYRWESAVPLVDKAGFYRIVLSPEFVGSSQVALDDVRLVDSTGQEVPYLLDAAMRYKTKGEFHDFVMTRNEVVGKRTLLELDRPDAGILVDHISLRLRNAEVAKPVEITGSDDGKNWYVIKNDRLQLVRGIQLANLTQEITLPPTDYRHYRIALNDSATAPVRVLGAQWFSQARSYGDYTAALAVRWTQQDSAGMTRIHIPTAFPHPIDRIEFAVSDTQAYHRTCDLIAWRTTTSGRGKKKHTSRSAETLASFSIGSDDGLTIDLPAVRAITFDLMFDNGDDRPLHFTDVRFLQLERTVAAMLQPGMRYTLITGDPQKSAPRYDMEYFRDKLPGALGKLVPGPLEMRPVPANAATVFDPSRWWVWAGIIILIIGIGAMAFRMLRSDQHQPN